jgi:nitrogen fixation protein FixH
MKNMAQSRPEDEKPRPLTGRAVLITLIVFFAIIFVVNGGLAYFALSTFGGVSKENAYREGLVYDSEIAMAAAQRERAWTVDANLAGVEAARTLELKVRDKSSNPEVGLSARATLVHPSDRRRDIAVALREISPGVYRGDYAAQAGERELVIELYRGNRRMFRSLNRVSLR